MTKRLFVVFALWLLCTACGSDQESNSSTLDAGSTSLDAASTDAEASSCIGDRELQVCGSSGCERATCRVDEWCESARCVPWREASYEVDFSLEVDESTNSVQVQVVEGGFPREFVEALRFDFGDGIAGWGDRLKHTYAAGGVYPVQLEVRFSNNHKISTTKLARVAPPSEFNPLVLTVNEIPTFMNGSEPVVLDQGTTDTSDDTTAPISLQVVRDRFVVNVRILEDSSDPIVRDSIALTSDVAFGETPAGESLTDKLVFDEPGISGRFELTPQFAPPVGSVELILRASTESGSEFERTLQVQAVDLTPATDPFDREHVWLFRTDRDYFTTTRVDGAGSQYQFSSTAVPDGEPDFAQELRLMGAQGDNQAVNEAYLEMIKESLRTQTYRYFGIADDGTPLEGIEFEIVWQGEAGAPDPDQFSPEGTFSMMRFGGFFDGYIGFSKFADYNEDRVDDSTAEYGVANAAILGTFTSLPQVSDAFLPINPQGGTPVGEHPLDEAVLAAEFDRYGSNAPDANERYDELTRVSRYIGLALAPVIAHEMGHAMGLMPDGLPPEGFFGGRPDVSFVGAQRTNSHHCDLPGLNLMQAGGDNLELVGRLNQLAEIPAGGGLIRLAEILSLETQLSPLSRAYLQRRLTHGID